MTPGLRIWHPFTQQTTDPVPIRVKKAEGVYLHTEDGRRIIDGISSWWVNLHGHGNPAIVKAISEQAARIDHVLLAGCTNETVEELAALLQEVLPAQLQHIFFSDDGSTAVEVALKMAVQYWKNVGRPEKRSIVALEHAYHGDTVGAMSVGDDSGFTESFKSLLFPVHRAHAAYCYRCPVGKTRADCNIDCANSLRALLEEKHDEIAAVIVEPLLQGAGGMIVHPVEFLQRVRHLCTEFGVLLINDEVLTGFGRCGRMFAGELAGVVPDLMCISKGLTGGVLPMAATICTDDIHQAFMGSDSSRTFWHGHSYTGNPIAAAAGVASLKIFKTQPVFERIKLISKIHCERLAAIREHPALGDARSIGTMAAVELKADDPGYFSTLGPKLYKYFVDSGVLLRPLGNVIYILPPYVISSAELNFIHDRVAEALDICARSTAASA
jgi:adenosylmethionine-8-amino-7-oxononanoate aminotransferase